MATVGQYFITKDMHQQLIDLGYPRAIRRGFTPEQAAEILRSGKTYIRPVSTRNSVDPERVEKATSRPRPPTPSNQHTITTQENNRLRKPDQDRSQKTQRKTAQRSARAIKDPNVSLNMETIRNRRKRIARRAEISARNQYRWNQSAERRNLYFKELKARLSKSPKRLEYYEAAHIRRWEARKARLETLRPVIPGLTGVLEKVASKKRRDEIVKPTRVFSDDIRTVWENLKSTGKRFNLESPFMIKAKSYLGKKWVRRGLIGVGAVIGFNLVRDRIARAFAPSRAIPEEYERGYDNIDEQLTDFGSPLNLAKAAHKVIVPYYSTVRSSLRTNVNTVLNHNLALRLSRNAIGHTRY